MTLEELLNIHGRLHFGEQDPQTQVIGLATDSRQVQAGFVFIAVRGTHQDGHDYLEQVVRAGALALVVEDRRRVPSNYKGAVLEVLDTRLSLQALAKSFQGSPGDQLKSVGVTGTNGKTSTVYMVEHLLGGLGISCGVIGTINHHLGQKIWETNLTSPDPLTLQSRLADFLSLGAEAFAIEVSSHALHQNRLLQGLDVCIFTNLSRDHLDYHGSMENYLQSKIKLFSPALCKEDGHGFAVINGDDSVAAEVIGAAKAHRQVFTFGKGKQNDFVFTILKSDLLGVEFDLTGPKQQTWRVSSPLMGEHNVYNLTGSLAAVYSLGGDLSQAIAGWRRFPGVPGRLQRISREDLGIHCFIDYAHTPDALEQVLKTLRTQIKAGQRLVTLFGCGGDRDPGKRPLMGEVATRYSDQIWLTSDNPRSESPEHILADIRKGVTTGSQVFEEVDRAQAIHQMLLSSQRGDVFLVAGKGHEKTQTIGASVLPFDDYEVVQKALKGKEKS